MKPKHCLLTTCCLCLVFASHYVSAIHRWKLHKHSKQAERARMMEIC